MPISLTGTESGTRLAVLTDPAMLARSCAADGVPTDAWWGKANAFYCPLTVASGTGWRHGTARLLISPAEYDDLVSLVDDRDAFRLTFTDDDGGSFALWPLSLTGNENVLPSDPDDAGSIYMVELADLRYRMAQVPVSRQYNTRDSSGGYNPASLNGAFAWTWATLVADLWSKLYAALPEYLDLTQPVFPASVPMGDVPEGFYFYKENAWEALCRVAEAAGCWCRYDPVDNAVELIDAAAAAPGFGADAAARTIWDTSVGRENLSRWPESLVVSFPRMGRNDRYQATVATGVAGAKAGTSEVVWDDLPAVGDPVLNAAALAARAANILKLWKWWFPASWVQDNFECIGVVDDARRNVGYDGYSEWAVFDTHDGRFNGGVITAMAARQQWANRDKAFFADAGAGGSGGGSNRVIEYLYDDICSGGYLFRFRATLYQSRVDNQIYSSSYQFLGLNGCCSCGGSSGGGGSGGGSGSAPCLDGFGYSTLTISNKTGDCTCMADTLIGTPGTGGATSNWSGNSCEGNPLFQLFCTGGQWTMTVNGGTYTCTLVAYTPGVIVFDTPLMASTCAGGTGSVRLTVTP